MSLGVDYAIFPFPAAQEGLAGFARVWCLECMSFFARGVLTSVHNGQEEYAMIRERMVLQTAVTFGVRCSERSALHFALFAFLALLSPTNTKATQKNVLVMSEGHGRVSINQMASSLRAHFSGSPNFSIVDLENPRFEEKSYQENLAEAFQAAYAHEKLDLVIAVGITPLQFAVQYRDKMFPAVPIVFMSNDSSLPEQTQPGVTGVVSPMGVPETIDLALRLHPDTQAIAIIGQSSGTFGDNFWLAAEHAELLRHHDKVKEIDLVGAASPELLQRVAELPPHTVVLFQLYPEDSSQPAFGALDVLAAVVQRFPTYSILPHITVGHGGVGGASYDPPVDAVLAGQLAARVLSGERPEDIPVVLNNKINLSVDWRELRRWNIPESALPPGTVVLYRDPTLWERGWKYFVAGIAVILLQTTSILALFWQRTRKRRAEDELTKSEEKFSKTFRQSPLVLTISRTSDSRFIDVNESFEKHLGWKRDEVIGRTPFDFGLWANADQRAAFVSQIQANGSVRDLEALARSKNGELRTLLISAEVLDVAGQSCTLSVAADITERKKAEEMLSTMSRRLIEAHEEERTRIARELHDDINQRLALVAIRMETTQQVAPHSVANLLSCIREARKGLADITDDVQGLSHRLHSSKLDYLGIVAAAKGFCQELSEQKKVEIDFTHANIPQGVPKELSLCLFRVLQESLQNAVKHSGVRHFKVELRGTSGELELIVSDSGVGFDQQEAVNRRGLGLISMQERVHLLDGEFSIRSEPGRGTTVFARVPANSEVRGTAAAI
jgi:PAS domain S-box-containing protein